MADGASSPAYEQVATTLPFSWRTELTSPLCPRQFCLLAKSQKGRAIVQLIQQVLNKEKIYVFGELLGMESIQALRSSEFAEHYRLLELFCFGTYSEYLKV